LFDIVTLGGVDVAIAAAQNYRFLRSKAITIRGTIDLIIATWCIKNHVPLLHSDRDFHEMEKWLGLKSWA
jgi:predicted nucleic acid-binding protein